MGVNEIQGRRMDVRGNDVARAIGARLRDARRSVGLTQNQVAKDFKIARQMVSRWETGALPSALQLHAVGIAYGVSMDWLFYGVKCLPLGGVLKDVFREAPVASADGTRERQSAS
jgi:transcriptional regulator with XRE-family HTH domain